MDLPVIFGVLIAELVKLAELPALADATDPVAVEVTPLEPHPGMYDGE